jgi:hypothetical protein
VRVEMDVGVEYFEKTDHEFVVNLKTGRVSVLRE